MLTIIHLQVSHFMSSNNDSWETTCVFNDGNTVDFF